MRLVFQGNSHQTVGVGWSKCQSFLWFFGFCFRFKTLKRTDASWTSRFFFFPLNVMHCVRRYQINDTLTLFVLSATGLTESSERCSEEERTHLGSKVNVRQEAGGAGCSLVRRSSRWPSPPRWSHTTPPMGGKRRWTQVRRLSSVQQIVKWKNLRARNLSFGRVGG